MRKSFTLLEIMIVCLILVILASVGIGSYQLMLNKARERKCAMQQEIAVRTAYIKSQETGSLGKLDLFQDIEYLGKAYAQAMKEADWYTKFSIFFVKINTPKQAYAAITDIVDPAIMKKYGVDPGVLFCPVSGLRYGVNANLVSTWKWADIPAGTIIIGDSATPTFNALDALLPVHKTTLFSSNRNAVGTTVEGTTLSLEYASAGSSPQSIKAMKSGITFRPISPITESTGAKLSNKGIECVQYKTDTEAKTSGCPISKTSIPTSTEESTTEEPTTEEPTTEEPTSEISLWDSDLSDTEIFASSEFDIQFNNSGLRGFEKQIVTAIFGTGDSSWYKYFKNPETMHPTDIVNFSDKYLADLRQDLFLLHSGELLRLRDLTILEVYELCYPDKCSP